MKTCYIVRVIEEDGAFGMMLGDDGVPFAVTLERTFEDKRVVVVDGEYICPKDFYHGGGYATFGIPVEGHTRVLFHKGNVEENSLACVLVGEKFEPFNGKPGIAESGKGFSEFMARYGAEEAFRLKVSSVAPVAYAA